MSNCSHCNQILKPAPGYNAKYGTGWDYEGTRCKRCNGYVDSCNLVCPQIARDFTPKMLEHIKEAPDERTAMLVLWIWPDEKAAITLVKDFRETVQKLWRDSHSADAYIGEAHHGAFVELLLIHHPFEDDTVCKKCGTKTVPTVVHNNGPVVFGDAQILVCPKCQEGNPALSAKEVHEET